MSKCSDKKHDMEHMPKGVREVLEMCETRRMAERNCRDCIYRGQSCTAAKIWLGVDPNGRPNDIYLRQRRK